MFSSQAWSRCFLALVRLFSYGVTTPHPYAHHPDTILLRNLGHTLILGAKANRQLSSRQATLDAGRCWTALQSRWQRCGMRGNPP